MPRGPDGKAGFLDTGAHRQRGEQRKNNYHTYRWRRDYLSRASKHIDAAKENLCTLDRLLRARGSLDAMQHRQLKLELERQCRDYQRLVKKCELLSRLIASKTLGLIDPDKHKKKPLPTNLLRKGVARSVAELDQLEAEIAASLKERS